MPNVVVKPAGNMLRLRCPSFGNPRPNITWYKNNEEPKRTLGTVVMSKWTFRLEDLVPEDSGNYTCVVCNELGCINRTSKVEIVGECLSFSFLPLLSFYCVTDSTMFRLRIFMCVCVCVYIVKYRFAQNTHTIELRLYEFIIGVRISYNVRCPLILSSISDFSFRFNKSSFYRIYIKIWSSNKWNSTVVYCSAVHTNTYLCTLNNFNKFCKSTNLYKNPQSGDD